MKRLIIKEHGAARINCINCPKRGDCYDSADCVNALIERLDYYENLLEENGLLLEEE